ncbi:phosphotransferase enzyme family protein [Actinoplanes sp. CA-054009]
MTEEMQRGRFAKPVRHGDTVERGTGPGSANIHALLQYLHERGFELAPRFVGVSDDGTRELLSYLPGDTGYPPLPVQLRSEQALVSVASAIRRLHDASQGFTAPRPGRWHGQEIAAPVETDIIGHGDLAPWNIVFNDAEVVGIIDFDFARPSTRAWDLSYAAHHFVPFHPPAGLAGFGWEQEPDRAARLRMFAAAYGPEMPPAALVDAAALRMLNIAAHIEDRVRADDPAFAVHAEEGHADGYRGAADYIITHRADLLA